MSRAACTLCNCLAMLFSSASLVLELISQYSNDSNNKIYDLHCYFHVFTIFVDSFLSEFFLKFVILYMETEMLFPITVYMK